MKSKPYLLITLAFFALSSGRCKKSKCDDPQFSTGYIIGYDPCTAKSNGKKGYVIKFDNLTDTVVAYFVLPTSISIPDNLFDNYRTDYLFPEAHRTAHQIKARYHLASTSEFEFSICHTDILTGAFLAATKAKQYVIDSFE